MPDNCQRLTCRDCQAKILQHGIASGAVIEPYVIEADHTPQPPHRLLGALHHQRLIINQGKDPFTGGQPLLKLTPKRGDAGERVEEDRQPLHKEIPLAHGDGLVDRHQPAHIDDRRHANAGDGVEQREDAAEDRHAPDLHPIGQFIGRLKILVDSGFLAKVLGYRNAADRLLIVAFTVAWAR